jgi:glycosyltransferase involved in cell wall biosynthesis
VATAIDGAQDLLTNGVMDGGILVPPDDAAELALALELILRDDAWRDRLGRSARQRVERTCSNEAVGKQLYSFFFKVKR